MAKETKYVVAPGCSFVGSGKTYNPGDEIDVSAFKGDTKRFEGFLSGKTPKIIPAPPEPTASAPPKPAPTEEQNADNKKYTREELEKIALKKLGTEKDKFESMKDEELKQFLEDAGVLE